MFIRDKLERNKALLNLKKTSVEPTALHNWVKDFFPENPLVFKESKLQKIATLLFGLTLMLITTIAFFQGAGAYVLIFGLTGAVLVVKAWFFSSNYTLELATSGVKYNGDVYEWQSIAASLILEEALGGSYRTYLVLALNNNEILQLEVTDVILENERLMGLSKFMIPETRLISQFVAHFGQRDSSAIQ